MFRALHGLSGITIRQNARCNLIANARWCSSSKAAYLEKLTGDDAGIAVLSLNRPKARNAVNRDLLDEINKTVAAIRFDKSVRVLILKSSTEKMFCAGADLKERATMSQQEASEFVYLLRKSFSEIEKLPMPSIASIDGAALGGGLEIAMCFDIRIAGKNSKIGLPETKLAIIPGAGGTQRLSRIVGPARAKELIFTSRILDHKTAEKYGIINHAVDTDPYEKALEIAREVLPAGPVALRAAKIAIDQGYDVDKTSGMVLEETCYAQVIPTKDRIEGLTAFREKRKPMYTGE